MDAHERYLEHIGMVIAHINELIRQIQLDVLELEKRKEAEKLAIMQGIPSYLPSSAMPAEENK